MIQFVVLEGADARMSKKPRVRELCLDIESNIQANLATYSSGFPHDESWPYIDGVILNLNSDSDQALIDLEDTWLPILSERAPNKKIVVVKTREEFNDNKIQNKLKDYNNITYIELEPGVNFSRNRDAMLTVVNCFDGALQKERNKPEYKEACEKDSFRAESKEKDDLFFRKICYLGSNINSRNENHSLEGNESIRLNTLLTQINKALRCPPPRLYWELSNNTEQAIDKEIEFIKLNEKFNKIQDRINDLPENLRSEFNKMKPQMELFLSRSKDCLNSEDLPLLDSDFTTVLKQFLNDICDVLNLGRPFHISPSKGTFEEIDSQIQITPTRSR